jgi:hypothetical protein
MFCQICGVPERLEIQAVDTSGYGEYGCRITHPKLIIQREHVQQERGCQDIALLDGCFASGGMMNALPLLP